MKPMPSRQEIDAGQFQAFGAFDGVEKKGEKVIEKAEKGKRVQPKRELKAQLRQHLLSLPTTASLLFDNDNRHSDPCNT